MNKQAALYNALMESLELSHIPIGKRLLLILEWENPSNDVFFLPSGCIKDWVVKCVAPYLEWDESTHDKLYSPYMLEVMLDTAWDISNVEQSLEYGLRNIHTTTWESFRTYLSTLSYRQIQGMIADGRHYYMTTPKPVKLDNYLLTIMRDTSPHVSRKSTRRTL